MNYTGILKSLDQLNASIPRATMRGRAFMPIGAHFGITQNCNMRCTYCFEDEYLEHKRKESIQDEEMSLEKVKSLIDEFGRRSVITFSGGEPFLLPHMMDYIRHAARRHYTTVISNGSLLREDSIKELVRLAPHTALQPGLILTGFSVHSLKDDYDPITKTKGFYTKVARNIRMLAEEKERQGKAYPKINIRKLVVPETAEHIAPLYDLAKEVNATAVNLIEHNTIWNHSLIEHADEPDPMASGEPVGKIDRPVLAEQLDYVTANSKKDNIYVRYTPAVPRSEFEKHYTESAWTNMGDYGCNAPWSRAAISIYGDVFICPYINVGNVKDKSFREVWNGEKARTFRLQLKEKKVFPMCRGCCHVEYRGKAKV